MKQMDKIGKISLWFVCGNAAFDGNPEAEIKRILHELAERIVDRGPDATIRDANGNFIGILNVDFDGEDDEESETA